MMLNEIMQGEFQLLQQFGIVSNTFCVWMQRMAKTDLEGAEPDALA